MLKFEPNKSYSTRSICDYDCIIDVTIVSRTAKTVTVAKNPLGRDKLTYRVGVYDNMEFIRPWGNYSMSPIIRADDKVS